MPGGQTVKKTVVLITLLTIILLLAACGGKSSYRSDVSMTALSGAVEQYIDGSALAEMTESYVSGMMKMDTSLFEEYLVKISAYGSSIDEYGIFKAADEGGSDAVKAQVEAYLQFRRDTWMEEYLPEEKPKLTQAAVKTCGRYVIYVIMGDDARQNALDAFENELKA